jgi:3-oxoacyl-[acyl-carrier protein] reductase
MSVDNELAGRVAIVTGSARNIGRAIAMSLAEGGAAVLVSAKRAQAEVDARPRHWLTSAIRRQRPA